MKTTNSEPLVSIVTPVHNEEQYLSECIESVLAQTYQNWDYTIVNNCSTDSSLVIARSYAAKDRRIRVHDNQHFLEMLANHNLAVRQISPASKYCKVVLGDDWILPDCLEKMVAVAEEFPSAGIISAYQLHGQHVRSVGLPDHQRLVTGREASRHFLMQTLCLFGTQTSVLYRADLVRSRNPFYVESDMCADFEVCLALLRTLDLGFVHQVLTFSRPRPSSMGAISYDMGANFGSFLGMLFAYGKECLSEEEFNTALQLQLNQYYRFLGRRFWVERDRTFWAYHRRTFAKVGVPFRRSRLARAAIRQLCGSVLEPSATIESIKRVLLLRGIRQQNTRRVVLEFGTVPGFGADSIEAGDQRIKQS